MNETGWQERVRAEEMDLLVKTGKLETYRSTDDYHRLERADRDRLTAQLMFMRGYAAMLKARIDGFR
jgi:hypothetical protein